jgi:hypothetical protein
VRKAFYDDHNGEKLGKEPYIGHLCYHFELFTKGETKRLVVNLPPRHLKTFLGSICLTAWLLAHNPSARIMVVAFGDKLAEEITFRIRHILRSDWY